MPSGIVPTRMATAAIVAFAAALVGVGAPFAQPVAIRAPATSAATFQKWCGDCHTRPTGPGTMALQRKYNGAIPAVLEQRTDLSPEFVAVVVRQGISFMPSFRKTEISDAELAQLGAYLATSKGRNRSKVRRP